MINLNDYGYSGDPFTDENGLIPARITEVHRDRYKAVCEDGEVSAVLKGSFFHEAAERSNFPAVGDFVLLKHRSQVVKVLPRKSKFSRTDFSGHAAGYVKTIREQVVAANFDYVFIMSSLNQDFKVNRIARYITAARQSGGLPVVILTKADLCDHIGEQIEAVKKTAPDIPIVTLSSLTGEGLDQLDDYLKPAKTIVFLGMSGVGKSSLLNKLAGHELMAVKEIREDDARGRHTTTHRQMIRLPSGTLVIDTPGMRELGLWNADEGIRASFAEVETLIAQCRFSDCSHKGEPGCAVQAALADGSLAAKQWKGYLSQKREAGFGKNKSHRENKKK